MVTKILPLACVAFTVTVFVAEEVLVVETRDLLVYFDIAKDLKTG